MITTIPEQTLATPIENKPAPKPAPIDYTLYGVKDKYFVKLKAPDSKEVQITKQEYDELLQTKNNSHSRMHKQ